MKWPRLQFGTSTLLLATAFAAVCVGGTLPLWRAMGPRDWDFIGFYLGVFSPILVPWLFVAYAVGRRTLTPKIVLTFAIAEAVAAGIFLALAR